MRQKCLWLAVGLMLAALALPASALDFAAFDQHGGSDFFTVLDEEGKTVSKLGSLVSVGDYLITEDDSGYKVTSVDGFNATAKLEGKVDLTQPGWVMVQADRPTLSDTEAVPVANGDGKKEIGLYFTHSEESYVPSSGKAQEKRGDIYQVGETLAESLRKNGVTAKVNENIHSPRDSMSYNRSRNTATQLLKDRPQMLVDVHRDGIPDPNYYNKTVKNKPIAQTRLVVGKQNANRAVNFDFAKEIKAKANEMYPGLVKEIFWARGNYNQDLAPRTVLIEFGTHTNTLERAQAAAEMMGEVLASMVVGAAPQGGRDQQRPTGRTVGTAGPGTPSGGWTSALWVLGIAVVGFIAYALINSKGWGGIGYMLSKFGSKEMTGFFGKISASRGKKKREIKIPPDSDQKDEEEN